VRTSVGMFWLLMAGGWGGEKDESKILITAAFRSERFIDRK
jgi:hypothetical protein